MRAIIYVIFTSYIFCLSSSFSQVELDLDEIIKQAVANAQNRYQLAAKTSEERTKGGELPVFANLHEIPYFFSPYS